MATTKEEIFAKMRATDLELPKIRDVGIAYATWLSKVFDLLPQEHQQNAILLGAVVNTRSSRLIPVLKADQIEDWLEYCDKVYGEPATRS